jgi:chromosome condensin MukBEF MukE localization factor
VTEWFDATEGETRQRAVELMQGGCRELLKMVLGEEKATKLKEMRESGTDMDKIKAQIEEWVSALDDDRKKGMAAQYKPICAKAFQAS